MVEKHSSKLKIEVGKTPILIELNDLGVFNSIRDFYRPFETKKGPLYRIKVDIKNGLTRSLNLRDISLSYSDNIYKIESQEFKGFLDFKKNSGRITVHSLWPKETLINALKNICIFSIINRGGIVLHASGVVKKNKAYIFSGPSGSGKSTIARLSTTCSLLSEESIGIKPINRTFRAFAVPYKGDGEFPRRLNHYFEIAGLFRLVKDESNYVKVIPKPQALADFFILPYGFKNLITFSDYLNRYYRLIEKVSCFELHFLPHSSFWRSIDEHIN